MQAVAVVTGPESVVVSSFAVVPIFSVVDLSSSAVVPIFSVVEYGYWQVPSFPQVPVPLHVVSGLQNTNINEKRVNQPLNLKRTKKINLLEQLDEKY